MTRRDFVIGLRRDKSWTIPDPSAPLVFARAFHQGDYFRLDILGYSGANGTGTQVGDVPFYLADYRGSSLQLVSNWTTVSLSPLAGATSLAFSLTSTDVGQFGMNTPAFFAVDNLIAQTTAVPEPSSWLPCLIGCGVSLLASRMPKVFLTSKPALNREELCPC